MGRSGQWGRGRGKSGVCGRGVDKRGGVVFTLVLQTKSSAKSSSEQKLLPRSPTMPSRKAPQRPTALSAQHSRHSAASSSLTIFDSAIFCQVIPYRCFALESDRANSSRFGWTSVSVRLVAFGFPPSHHALQQGVAGAGERGDALCHQREHNGKEDDGTIARLHPQVQVGHAVPAQYHDMEGGMYRLVMQYQWSAMAWRKYGLCHAVPVQYMPWHGKRA